MRTTVTLDADVWRAVEELRRHKGLGISEAINELARRGLVDRTGARPRFVQRVSAMGKPKVPLDNIGEVLVLLEGDAHR